MNITRLVEKIFIRLFLIVTLIPLQSCSNTLIGEKLENSFDTTENSLISEKPTKVKVQKKVSKIKKVRSTKKDDEEENKNVQENLLKNNFISTKDRSSIQKTTKSTRKVIFNPQPYRIILKLSGANPSAPAETVTEALRKAGVQFEVEKIERFDEKNLIRDSSLKR